MLKNILIVSLRNLRRNKGYTLLNMLGLTLAISISMLAILKVNTEFSFEKTIRDYQRIYRINQDIFVSDQHMDVAVTPCAMAPTLPSIFPEIEYSVRMEMGNSSLKYNDKEFETERIVQTDTSFFSVFGIEILMGDKVNPLQSAECIALSKATAEKIFGNTNPLGQRLTYNGNTPVIVTAVYSNIPTNSHLKADALVSLEKHTTAPLDSWYDSSLFTYIKLTNALELEHKLNELMKEKTLEIREQMGWKSDFTLMPIEKIRLYSNRIGDSGGGSISHILALIAVSIIVVILAAVNYTNLSVALANRRAHEIGMRKISGSPKSFIILQFLTESIILSLVAFAIALPITEIGVGPFGRLTGYPLTFGFISDFSVTLLFLGFSLVLGIIAGIYPAFVLSTYKPISVIRKGNKSQNSSNRFRNILIVSQFAAGLALIIVTTIVYQQRQFLMQNALGFDKENTIVINTRNLGNHISLNVIKQELANIEGVKAISITSSNPPHNFSASNFIPEGSENNATILIPRLRGDCDFAKSLGIELIKGRELNCSLPGDSAAVLVNETLAKRMNWDDPIGKRIWKTLDENPLTVVGVIKDFHYESMHTAIKPLIIQQEDGIANMLIARMTPGNHPKTIDAIKQKWTEITGENEFNFEFVSDNYNSLYASEQGMSKGFTMLTIIAIFIACLGLVGLAAQSTSTRIKEIGIRKVLGSSIISLLLLIWWSFIRLVTFAIIIAWPAAYYLANDWLNNFAYRINISPWVFIATALAGLFLTILSIGSITYKAAKQNPINALKYE